MKVRRGGALTSGAIVCRVLALLFSAAAAGWWIYSPWLDCDGSISNACSYMGAGGIGLFLNFGIVVALAFVGLLLWTLPQDH